MVWPYAALHIKFLTLNFSFSIYRITICWILCNIFNIWSYTILPHTERSERRQSPLCKAMLNGNTYTKKSVKNKSWIRGTMGWKIFFQLIGAGLPYWPPFCLKSAVLCVCPLSRNKKLCNQFLSNQIFTKTRLVFIRLKYDVINVDWVWEV